MDEEKKDKRLCYLHLSSQDFEIHLGATYRKLKHEASFFFRTELANLLDNQVRLYKDV